MTKFKVGDKVRILDAGSIIGGRRRWRDGDVVNVEAIDTDGGIHLTSTNPMDDGSYIVYRREFRALKAVEPKHTKKSRIKALETNVTVLAQDAEIYKMRIAELERQLAAQKGDYDRIMKLADEWARLKDTAQRVVDGATVDDMPPFKIGDKVRVGANVSVGLTVGEVYEVVGVINAKGEYGAEFIVRDDGRENYSVDADEFYAFEKAETAYA